MTEELQTYLIEQCRHWMLPEELKALSRSGFTKDGEESSRKMALLNPVMEKFYGFNDEVTNTLAALSKEKLNLTIAERLLRDHGNEILNTCPRCEKLARTPLAKQCRHCGFDWH